jgi:hypothetical protein
VRLDVLYHAKGGVYKPVRKKSGEGRKPAGTDQGGSQLNQSSADMPAVDRDLQMGADGGIIPGKAAAARRDKCEKLWYNFS